MSLTIRLQKIFSILLITSLFSSCVNFEEVEITDIKSIKISEFGSSSLKFDSEIKIKNPNSYSIKVTDSYFDVFIKNNKVGEAKFDDKITIPANSNDFVAVSFLGTYDESQIGTITTLVGSSLFGSKDIDFKVDGFVEGKALMIKKKINLKHEGKVPLEFFN